MSKKMFFNNLNKTPVVSFIPAQIGKINTIIDSGQGLYMIAGGNQVAILSDLNSQYASVTTTITNVTNLNFTAGVWFNNSFCLISRNGWFFRFDTSCNELNRVSFGTELLNDILVNGSELVLLREKPNYVTGKFYKSTDGISFTSQSLSGTNLSKLFVLSNLPNGNILASGVFVYSDPIMEISSAYTFVSGYSFPYNSLFRHNNASVLNPIVITNSRRYNDQWFTRINGIWVSGQDTIFNFDTGSGVPILNYTAKINNNVLFLGDNGIWLADENYTSFEHLDTTPIPYLDFYTNKRAVNTNKATYVANNQTIIKVG